MLSPTNDSLSLSPSLKFSFKFSVSVSVSLPPLSNCACDWVYMCVLCVCVQPWLGALSFSIQILLWDWVMTWQIYGAVVLVLCIIQSVIGYLADLFWDPNRWASHYTLTCTIDRSLIHTLIYLLRFTFILTYTHSRIHPLTYRSFVKLKRKIPQKFSEFESVRGREAKQNELKWIKMKMKMKIK